MPVYYDKKLKRYYIQFDYRGHTYKRRLPAKTTKTSADELERKWRSDLLLESFGIEKERDIVYEKFLVNYFMPFAEKHYSPGSYKNVQTVLRSSLKILKGKGLRTIKPADIEKFKTLRENLPVTFKKSTRKRKPATIHRELNIISKVFSQAVKLDFLDYNPVSKVDRPKVYNEQDKIIPIDKVQEFLDNFNSAWARDIAILILNTGLRQNDALGLKKKHVDFENRIITLVQSKTQRPVEIPINDIVYDLLWKRKDKHNSLFFPSPKTGKVGTSIKKALAYAGKQTGLGKVGTRVLRRSYATWLDNLGYTDSDVAKLLGQKGVSVVHRYKRGKDRLRTGVNDIAKAQSCQNPTKQ